MRKPLLLLSPVMALCLSPAWAQESPGPTTTVISGAEIYHVVRGTGIFVTGGELIDRVAVEIDTARYTRAGPGESGRLNNAELVEYGPGSIFIVPPGVPHNATHAVTSDTDFLIYRFDPGRVLPQF